MSKFKALLALADTLNGPNGCPWDRKQTFFTLQPYLLEEAHEVLEAVDSGDSSKMAEELGDLFYIIIFYSKIAEKKGLFNIETIIDRVSEKLIGRHPHVFANLKLETAEEVAHKWDELKSKESPQLERQSVLDGIPATLSILIKAQKILKKISKKDKFCFNNSNPFSSFKTEEDVGEAMLGLVQQAEVLGVDAESSLRRALSRLEQQFRTWEKNQM